MKTFSKYFSIIFFVFGFAAVAIASGPSLTLKGMIRNQVYRPIRIAVHTDGTIAVADYHRKQIYLFNEDRTFRSSVSVPNSPLSVAFASDGSLYVGIQNNVLQMTRAGEVTDRFSTHGTALQTPVDIAVDAAGNVYVVDRDAHTITVCTSGGSTQSSFGGLGTDNGKFHSPSGVAIDASANELFVVDAGNSRIQVFSLSGEFHRAFGKHIEQVNSTWETVGAFARAQCVAVDAQHQVYVTDSGLDHVQIFNAQGSHLGFLGTEGHPSMRLRVPMGIAASANGKLFVTSVGSSDVREYSIGQATSVSPEKEVPTAYGLDQNYPNPFNPTTNIRFALPSSGFVTLRVYDVVGREVRTLLAEDRAVGVHTVEWNGTNDAGVMVASGIYFYRLDVNGGRFSQTNKMLFIK